MRLRQICIAIALVAIALLLARSFRMRRSSPAEIRSTQPSSRNSGTPSSGTHKRFSARELLNRLRTALLASDVQLADATWEELVALPRDAAQAIRDEIIACSAVFSKEDTTYWTYMLRALARIASPDVGLILLEGFTIVDTDVISVKPANIESALRPISEAICYAPSRELADKSIRLIDQVGKEAVRSSLIWLVGMLSKSIPELRKDLLALMFKHTDPEVRYVAARVIGVYQAKECLPELTQAVASFLASADNISSRDCTTMIEAFLKCAPIDELLQLIRDHVDAAKNDLNIDRLGFHIGIAFATGDIPSLDVVYARLIGEHSPKQQLLYLAAFGVAGGRSKDPRAVDIGLQFLESSENPQVRIAALNAVTHNSADHEVITRAFAFAAKDTAGVVRGFAMDDLLHRIVANPEVGSYSTLLSSTLLECDRKFTLRFLDRMTPALLRADISPLNRILTEMANDFPDPEIRAKAKKRLELNTAGSQAR